MKIVLLITDLYSRGGAEVFLENLALEIAKHSNINLSIVTIWDKVHPSFEHLKTNDNISFFSCGKKSSLDLIKPSIQLKKIIDKIKPDVVHTHRNVYPTYFLAYRFKKPLFKLIHTFHNIPEKEATKFGISIIRKLIYKQYIKCVGISNIISQKISVFYNLKNNEIETVYNGLCLRDSFYASKKYDYDLICVARFDEQKNHIFLLKSIKMYNDLHPNAKIKLCLVGKGQLQEFLEAFVLDNDLSEYVVFAGEVVDPYPLLSRSKIFVLTSLYEGNPISVLEAMDAGTALLLPNVGGIPDVVKDGENGILFEVENQDDFICKLEKLIRDKQLIEKMSNDNHFYVKKYSMICCGLNYIEVYYKVLGGKE